jgi:chemotaxis protein MotB
MNINLKNEGLNIQLEKAREDVIFLQEKMIALKDDYNNRIIILQDELDKKIALFEDKRDESALRNEQIIKLVSERNQLALLLKIKNLQLENNSEKIINFEAQINNLKTNINDLGLDLENKEKMIIDLRGENETQNNLLAELKTDKLNMDIASIDQEKVIQDNEQIIIDLRKKEADNSQKLEKLKSILLSTGQKAKTSSNEVQILNIQISELKKQIQALQALLDASEKRDIDQQARIADLGKRLNVALAQRVKELSEYRSEFFGKLKEIIGNRDDIKIIGDRFVFQSEVLFDSGEANIGIEGQRQLAKLSVAIQDLINEIPQEINWILRIDGHTDRVPIKNSRYESNWELSAARAISVVDFLIKTGIPPNRLAATGRGEFMPLETEDNEIAYKKNRRIEIKLTES